MQIYIPRKLFYLQTSLPLLRSLSLCFSPFPAATAAVAALPPPSPPPLLCLSFTYFSLEGLVLTPLEEAAASLRH